MEVPSAEWHQEAEMRMATREAAARIAAGEFSDAVIGLGKSLERQIRLLGLEHECTANGVFPGAEYVAHALRAQNQKVPA